ncbi:hypothetical protein BRC97_06970 [Halobacteriales archaeon QS_6_71_20]|nr:MAG: hypothetical protein BRC97_06970 [Halobacteriales archaeon QS_6_71_20]
MSRTSITIDATTKDRLATLKREDETWDEFLIRISSDEEPIEFGAWSDDDADEAMRRLRNGRERSQ